MALPACIWKRRNRHHKSKHPTETRHWDAVAMAEDASVIKFVSSMDETINHHANNGQKWHTPRHDKEYGKETVFRRLPQPDMTRQLKQCLNLRCDQLSSFFYEQTHFWRRMGYNKYAVHSIWQCQRKPEIALTMEHILFIALSERILVFLAHSI